MATSAVLAPSLPRLPLWQKPGPGVAIDWAHPLTRNLVGCWLFNEGAGNRFMDLVASQDMTPNGNFALGWQRSIQNWDGESAYIFGMSTGGGASIPGNVTSLRNYDASDFTIMVVASLTGFGPTGNRQFLGGRASITFGNNYTTNQLGYVNEGVAWRASGTTLSARTKYAVVLTCKSGLVTLYCNGTSVYSNSESWGQGAGAKPQVVTVEAGSSNNVYFNRLLIWTEALPASKVLRLYNDPFCFLKRFDSRLSYASTSIINTGTSSLQSYSSSGESGRLLADGVAGRTASSSTGISGHGQLSGSKGLGSTSWASSAGRAVLAGSGSTSDALATGPVGRLLTAGALSVADAAILFPAGRLLTDGSTALAGRASLAAAAGSLLAGQGQWQALMGPAAVGHVLATGTLALVEQLVCLPVGRLLVDGASHIVPVTVLRGSSGLLVGGQGGLVAATWAGVAARVLAAGTLGLDDGSLLLARAGKLEFAAAALSSQSALALGGHLQAGAAVRALAGTALASSAALVAGAVLTGVAPSVVRGLGHLLGHGSLDARLLSRLLLGGFVYDPSKVPELTFSLAMMTGLGLSLTSMTNEELALPVMSELSV